MNAVDAKSGLFPVDSSLINSEFIRRLQEQRVLHKREVAFHLAEVEKYGAADEALTSMIQAAEKIVAIMSPAPTMAADAPDEARVEAVSRSPNWTEAAMAVLIHAIASYLAPVTRFGDSASGLSPRRGRGTTSPWPAGPDHRRRQRGHRAAPRSACRRLAAGGAA